MSFYSWPLVVGCVVGMVVMVVGWVELPLVATSFDGKGVTVLVECRGCGDVWEWVCVVWGDRVVGRRWLLGLA